MTAPPTHERAHYCECWDLEHGPPCEECREVLAKAREREAAEAQAAAARLSEDVEF